MKYLSKKIGSGMFVLIIFIAASCQLHVDNHNEGHYVLEEVQIKNDSSLLIPAATDGMSFFPCSDCHLDMVANPKRRELVEMHDDVLFDHDSENRWCLACHDLNQRDSLRLASGKLLSFDESYKLCGQCHGPKIRDWRLGIHGKRTGMWNGKKEYRLCVSCHNPHSPKIKPIEPLAAPLKPEQISIDSIRKDTDEKE